MSLVLKSNNLSTANLGNINGLPAQDYSLFLDFENGEYFKKVGNTKSALTEAQILTCTSQKNLPAKPLTMDRIGSKSVITEQVPRFWGARGRYGLLIEADQTNLFLNSEAPVSQTISIPAGSVVVVSCIGTGSLNVTGANIDSATVTESAPKTITPLNQAQSISLNVAVIGSLSHAQVVRCSGVPTVHSPITTGSSSRPSGPDNIELNQSLLLEILNSSANITILAQTVGVDYTFDTRAVNENRFFLETDTHICAVSLNKKTDSVGMRLASYTKAGGVQTAPIIVNSKTYVQNDAITQAISFNAAGLKGASNGGSFISSTSAVNYHQLKRFLFGTHIATPVIIQGANCIYTKLAIFNRELSESEIVEYSKAWI